MDSSQSKQKSRSPDIYNNNKDKSKKTFHNQNPYREITAWKSIEELQTVGQQLLLTLDLYSNDNLTQREVKKTKEDIKDGLDQVKIWRERMKSLPHCIESTAHLSEILLKDFTYDKNETELLRLAYASALTRTLNGYVDATISESRAKIAQNLSVMNISNILGIPDWIVHLRHDSSHHELPSIASLRQASRVLLSFLKADYWDRQFLFQHKEAQDLSAVTKFIKDYYLSSHTKDWDDLIQNTPKATLFHGILEFVYTNEHMILSTSNPSFPFHFLQIHDYFHQLFIKTHTFYPSFSKFLIKKLLLRYFDSSEANKKKLILCLVSYLNSKYYLSFLVQQPFKSKQQNFYAYQQFMLQLPTNHELNSQKIKDIKRKPIKNWIKNDISYITSPPSNTSLLLSIYPLCYYRHLVRNQFMNNSQGMQEEENDDLLNLLKCLISDSQEDNFGLNSEWKSYWCQIGVFHDNKKKNPSIETAEKAAMLLGCTSKQTKLSLEETEQLLDSFLNQEPSVKRQKLNKNAEDIKDEEVTNTMSAWVKCSQWDICPIGTIF